MKNQTITRISTILFLIGMASLLIINSYAETDNDPWEIWINQQTENTLNSMDELEEDQLTKQKVAIRQIFVSLANQLKKNMSSPPKVKKEILSKGIHVEIPNFPVDNSHIESIPTVLKEIEIPKPLNHMDIFEKISEMEVRVQKDLDSIINEKKPDYFIIVDKHVVKDSKNGWIKPLPENVNQNVEAIRKAYDKHYGNRLEGYTKNITHHKDGTTILSYKIPLPIEIVDEKYPRDEWIQMLLDSGISIDNFAEYHAYLLERDSLVHIEKHPNIWSSGLYGIPSTENWDTYKEAYIKERVLNLEIHKTSDILKAHDAAEFVKKKMYTVLKEESLNPDEIKKKIEQLLKDDNIDTSIIDSKDVQVYTINPNSLTTRVKTNSIKDMNKKIRRLSKRFEKLNKKLKELQSK